MVNGLIELDQLVTENAVICRLSQASVAEVAEIEAEANRPPWTEQLFANEFQNRCSRLYGARVAGRIVGFLLCHIIYDEAHIMNFGLRTSARGRGYGRALIEYVLRDLHEDSVHWVTLEVRVGNSVARKLYDSLGFLEVGLRERYYRDNQEDGVVLKLNLQQFINQFGSDTDWSDSA